MALLSIFAFFIYLVTVSGFQHPGLLVTNEDIDRAKDKIASHEDPWLSSWNKLTSLSFSSSSYSNQAAAIISRSTNGELLWHDAAAAFNLALRWKISNDDQYAVASAAVLVAWAEKLKSLSGGGDDDYLTAGLQGYEFANAAELLRDYAPFAEKGLSEVQSMMANIFLPMNLDFLNHRLGSEHNVKHFFANWEQCNIASAMAIGVLNDNQTAWDFAVNYFKTGTGNGAIYNGISDIVKEPGTDNPLGQGQESGRDQGHSALDFQLLGVIGQQAWNQGEDLFSYAENRILLGAEYFARYNLGHDVPFNSYTNGIVHYDAISAASRGAIRPTWELLHAHYVQIKGLDAPWTTEYLNYTLAYFGGFEGGAGSWGEGSGHYDGLGWGSLLYHLGDDVEIPASSSTAAKTSSTVTSSQPTGLLSSSKYNSPVFTPSTGRLSSTTSSSAFIASSTSTISVAVSDISSPLSYVTRTADMTSSATQLPPTKASSDSWTESSDDSTLSVSSSSSPTAGPRPLDDHRHHHHHNIHQGGKACHA